MTNLYMIKTSLIAIAAVAAMLFAASAHAAGQPNVLLIISDDMGYAEVGTANTPSLNQLANEGATFPNAYANSLCSPTRAALQTGRYSERSRVYTAYAENSTGGMAQSEVTLAEQFKAIGYSTALVGKWHLGRQDQFSPNVQGYDYFYGSRHGQIHPFTHRTTKGQNTYHDWWRNNSPLVETGYTTTLVMHEAMRLIETLPQPWFITVSWHAVHAPRLGPDGKEDYFGMLRAMDQATGQVVRRVDDLGMKQNTVVWYVNDNGGYPNSRNAGLKGEKGTLWEGGIRVPQIVRWPGQIASGPRGGNAHVIDVLPTLMDFTGSTPAKKPDGISLAGPLLNNTRVPTRQLFWSKNVTAPITAANDGRYKLVLSGTERFLFDLQTDPRELRNIAASRPGKVSTMRAAITTWRQGVGR